MAAFSWQALDTGGRLKKGVWEADSPKQLRQKLRAEGFTPVAVESASDKQAKPAGGEATKKRTYGFDRRLGAVDLAMFTRQLETLIRAKMPVEESLRVLASQTEKTTQRALMTALRSKIIEGMSLADALRQFPKAFPEYYAATISAGEQSGRLEHVMDRLADYTEEANNAKQKVLLALLYPLIITVIAIVVITVLMTVVVPKLVSVFENMGQELPLITRMLIGLSEFLQDFGLLLLILLVGLVVGFVYMYRRISFRQQVHELLLRMPLVSSIVRELNTGRFLRTYAILLGSSVSATQGMRIGANVLDNLPIRKALLDSSERVREGASISSALTRTSYFMPMALNLIASGEASGNLAEMLERAGEGQERTLQARITAAVGVLEPLMIVAMGAIVLLIVMAILMPILEINQMVN